MFGKSFGCVYAIYSMLFLHNAARNGEQNITICLRSKRNLEMFDQFVIDNADFLTKESGLDVLEIIHNNNHCTVIIYHKKPLFWDILWEFSSNSYLFGKKNFQYSAQILIFCVLVIGCLMYMNNSN